MCLLPCLSFSVWLAGWCANRAVVASQSWPSNGAISFRSAPQEARHPLLGALMTAMAALLKDYKTELEDILVADKQV